MDKYVEQNQFSQRAFEQFASHARTLAQFKLTDNEFQSWLSENSGSIFKWYDLFNAQVLKSRLGYPQTEIWQEPVLEQMTSDLLDSLVAKNRLQWKTATPTLCLSHDVDHLGASRIAQLKNLVAGKWMPIWKPLKSYLPAIQSLFEFNSFLPRGSWTVFVAKPVSVGSLVPRIKQIVFDPTYTENHPAFNEFVALLKKHGPDVGLHGSILSISHGLLSQEKLELERVLQQPVNLLRQHWLHLPGEKNHPYEVIHESGFEGDSTLGWNGHLGFRGGWTRPFPVVSPSGAKIWSVPLVIMDRPLYDVKPVDAAFEKAVQLLEQVYDRKGTVSINWHEACMDSDFGWFELYQRIVIWAKEKGFRFSGIAAALKEAKQ